MKNQNKTYVKKSTCTQNEKDSINRIELAIEDQIALFAEIIVDILIAETNIKNATNEESKEFAGGREPGNTKREF